MVQQFNFPTTIRLGDGVLSECADQLKSAGCAKPLIVTDRGIAGLTWLTELRDDLKTQGLDAEIYCEFEGNPIETHVSDGVSAMHAHHSDALVIVGGGAALDVGKAIAIKAHHPGTLFDYEDKDDALQVDGRVPYMIAVPTTAGTGSEVGRSSVISDNKTKAKKIIFSPRMLPNLVLADPTLTYELPAKVTAATGMDALTHCVEAYLAKGYHPMCDGIALQGVRLVAQALGKVFKDPRHAEARRDMLIASMMGAVAFQKGLGVNHSCAHALSTHYDTHHGLANSLMMPACMSFNAEAVPERLADLARAAGVGEDAQSFVKWVGELAASLALPTSLAELNIAITDGLLDTAVADICHPMNPREVTREDFRRLYLSAGASS